MSISHSSALSLNHLSALSSGSWLGLLASTMGMEDLGRSRVLVRGDVTLPGEARLVVQIVPPRKLDSDCARKARPLAAVQRSVSAQELAQGVELSILHEGAMADGCEVVAWLEPSGSDLEFGALTALPGRPLAFATSTLQGGYARLAFASAVSAAA